MGWQILPNSLCISLCDRSASAIACSRSSINRSCSACSLAILSLNTPPFIYIFIKSKPSFPEEPHVLLELSFAFLICLSSLFSILLSNSGLFFEFFHFSPAIHLI
ncbi:hypothetical protein WR25_14968 [Diploscapter pachys]|uniref:Uncharacterized protein n=1 Tax=Diploscapter pachys TaxID=2018661 RepID=A0A2A2LS38_9BILA|nr:hypothetical protein WR25_14968 [Diploscapter pachys]